MAQKALFFNQSFEICIYHLQSPWSTRTFHKEGESVLKTSLKYFQNEKGLFMGLEESSVLTHWEEGSL